MACLPEGSDEKRGHTPLIAAGVFPPVLLMPSKIPRQRGRGALLGDAGHPGC